MSKIDDNEDEMESTSPESSLIEEVRDKALVINYIFDDLTDPETGELRRTVVTSEDIQKAKRVCVPKYNLKLKIEGQAFNFFKDIVRMKRAQRAWPQRLRSLGWTGEQRTGRGDIFEFVRITDDHPDNLAFDLEPSSITPRFLVQTLSLPLATKTLGRSDESWLLQSAVNLRIVETHFSSGACQVEPLSITHLQMDIKLRRTQIDALYLLEYRGTAGTSSALITVEAKQHNQRILVEQVAWQAKAAFESTRTEAVLPLALATVRGEGVYVAEFEIVRRGMSVPDRPILFRDAVYRLQPPLAGI